MTTTVKTTKKQVLEALNGTEYQNENKNGVLTVWFHEGNGWNFRVSYNFRANKTKIVRYHTNGHMNRDDSKQEFEGLHIATNHQEAESLFY